MHGVSEDWKRESEDYNDDINFHKVRVSVGARVKGFKPLWGQAIEPEVFLRPVLLKA